MRGIMICQGDARGCGGRGGRDFRFFEKKLGKKLPCWVVARLNIYNSKNSLVGLQPGKKAFAELFSKSDNASPRVSISPINQQQQKINKIRLKVTRIFATI